MIKNFLNKLIKPAEEHPASESVPSDHIDKQLSTEKIKAVVAELTNSDQQFKEAGFIMEQLNIEIGLQPKIIPQFKQSREISSEDEARLLKQLVDKPIVKFVLISLFKSSKMKALLSDSEFYFYGIEIEITAEPTVKTLFKRKYSASDSLENFTPPINHPTH